MYTPYEVRRGTSPSGKWKLTISNQNRPVYHKFRWKFMQADLCLRCPLTESIGTVVCSLVYVDEQRMSI